MKRELRKDFTMLLLVIVFALSTAVVSAKVQSTTNVVADIPFAFSVGHKTMPAGEYSVKTILSSNSGLLIQSADRKNLAIRLSVETDRRKGKTNARLIFHRYGERYFLAEVWNGSDQTGRQLLKSQEERAMERELTIAAINDKSGQAPYETVEVVAMLR